jgi:curved DNA-binding protein
MSDYYNTLGVPKSASDDEIKKAYRSAAMKHHPDRGGDQGKFQEIQAAYATLSDPQKRAEYDNPAPQFGGGGFHFHSGEGFEHIFGQGSPFGDIFGFHQQRRPAQNRPIQIQTSITLDDAFTGKELIASINLPSGQEQAINVSIPKGIHNGTTLKLSGMGDDRVPGVPRGDILLTIHVVDHFYFSRQGDDLITNVEVSCIDAMVGGTITVTTIDNRKLETKIPAGMQHDSMLNINGYGMPNFSMPGRRGNLLLRVKLVVPTLDDEQQEKIRKIKL